LQIGLRRFHMIVDNIKNYAKYSHLPSRIVQAIHYIGSTDFTNVDDGQYELDGRKLVSIVMRYKTRLPPEAIWKSHRKYIDVQFMAYGNEKVGIAPMAQAPVVKTPYNEEKDVIFYEPGTEYFEAAMGTFMIFYPDDIHAPSLARGNPQVPEDVVKVVVKVA